MFHLSRFPLRMSILGLVIVAVVCGIFGFILPWHITHILHDCSVGGARPTTAPEGQCPDVTYSPAIALFVPETLIEGTRHSVTTLFFYIIFGGMAFLVIIALVTIFTQQRRVLTNIATVALVAGLIAVFLVELLYSFEVSLVYYDAGPGLHQETFGWGILLTIASLILLQLSIGRQIFSPSSESLVIDETITPS